MRWRHNGSSMEFPTNVKKQENGWISARNGEDVHAFPLSERAFKVDEDSWHADHAEWRGGIITRRLAACDSELKSGESGKN